ncbi:MAG: LysM peptidoglycan-binding domain-containing protein [Proteobacteria bacterium]|nr:LysM peptidoglycan-binding domain-containing protein [Pseudomonadota bacterium]
MNQQRQQAPAQSAPVTAPAQSVSAPGEGNAAAASTVPGVVTENRGGSAYTIRAGDTLWGIAEATYGSGRFWNDIYLANVAKCADGGNLILVGDVLVLPSIAVPSEQPAPPMDSQFGVCVAVVPTLEVEDWGSFHVFPNAATQAQLTAGPSGEPAIRENDMFNLRATWTAHQSSRLDELGQSGAELPASLPEERTAFVAVQLSRVPVESMGTHQASRVDAAMLALGENEYQMISALVAGDNAGVAGFLLKAVAAGNSAADVIWLSTQIAGQNLDWLQDNLTLSDPRATGGGVTQQFSHTCGVTTVQAIRGDYDPVYALRTRNANPDINAVDSSDANATNPSLAQEQQTMTETAYGGTTFGAHAGVGADRDNIAAGGGRWVDDHLNSLSDVTGLTYATTTDPPAATVVATLTSALDSGMETPIVIGNGPGQYTHYVLVTETELKDDGTRRFRIHDPWSGDTMWRTDQDILNGNLNIAGSNSVTGIESPSVVTP